VEGGAVCYSSPELGQKLYELKNFGIMDETTITGIGANAKMSEFHAAMGLVNLRYHNANVKRRQAIYNTYTEHLRGIPGLRIPEDTKKPLTQENLPGLRTPSDTAGPLTQKNYAYYPVVIEKTLFGADRDEVAKRLAAENIYVRKYFYPLTSDYQCYRELLPHADTPVADHIAASVITLPLSPSMEIEDAVRICELIKTCRR
jgi:dTDP-4-amino-4,6-dideoxygalactose transaminase